MRLSNYTFCHFCSFDVTLAFTSYTEIANFLQGFVDNEANLNEKASCAGVCSDYKQTKHFQCQSGSLCDRHVNDHEQAKCGGIIRDCQDIDDSDVNICETVSQMDWHPHRMKKKTFNNIIFNEKHALRYG